MLKYRWGEILRHYNNSLLGQIAEETMLERGLLPLFPSEVEKEVEAIRELPLPRHVRDLRSTPFFSIDNEDSRDLDQLTFAEKEHIYVAIADVNAYVNKGSPIDGYARHNTTSVYTPARIFPMLPPQLSNGLTSLNEQADRSATVVEMRVNRKGEALFKDLYPALVRNHAKLDYPRVALWLEQSTQISHVSTEIHEQLRLQDELAQRMLRFRSSQGSLGFETVELMAILDKGVAIGLKEREKNRAYELIEHFMIAGNIGITQFCIQQHLPILRRIVRVPKRWDRIMQLARALGTRLPPRPNVKALRDFLLKEHRDHPEQFADLSLCLIKLLGRGEYVLGTPGTEGHFDLALRDYAHTTAPNRRYPDLVMQRTLRHHFHSQKTPHSKKELISIAKRCTEKENDAAKVERRLIKCAAAMVLEKQIGTIFPAIVTGASHKGIWVRIDTLRLEGKLINSGELVDVGDRLKVQLVRVDVRKGHIDFKQA
jgi:VacB/RNase II family 3'-5' exoribonuclease